MSEDNLQETLDFGDSYYNYDCLMKDIPKLNVELIKNNCPHIYNPPFLCMFDMPDDIENLD
jgi:hypothetical protein